MWTLVTESDLPLLRETIAQKQWGSHVIVVGPSPTFEFAVSQVYSGLPAMEKTRLLPKPLTTVAPQLVSDKSP
jgi:hypothetical protein